MCKSQEQGQTLYSSYMSCCTIASVSVCWLLLGHVCWTSSSLKHQVSICLSTNALIYMASAQFSVVKATSLNFINPHMFEARPGSLCVTLFSERSSQPSWSFSNAILLFSPSYETAIFTLSKRKENIWMVRQYHVREQGADRGLETLPALGGKKKKIKRKRFSFKALFP